MDNVVGNLGTSDREELGLLLMGEQVDLTEFLTHIGIHFKECAEAEQKLRLLMFNQLGEEYHQALVEATGDVILDLVASLTCIRNESYSLSCQLIESLGGKVPEELVNCGPEQDREVRTGDTKEGQKDAE